MRKILLIFKNSILRNKLAIVTALAAAALMSFIFSGKANADGVVYTEDKISIGVVDGDNSALSEDFRKYFSDTLGVEIIHEKYDFLSNRLIDRQISAIIEIPRGFERAAADGNPEKLEITMLDDYENSAFIEAYIDSYMRSVSIISQAAGGRAETFSEMLAEQNNPNTVKLAEANSQTDKRAQTADAYFLTVGFMLVIISGVTVFISNQILVDRQLGTFDRMKCSPLKSSEYVIGVGLFGVVCCTVSNLTFNLFAYLSGGEMPVPLPLGLLINELFILFSVGLAMLFALLANNQRTLMTLGVGYATLGSMLGGAWFPIEVNLGFVGSIAKIFPQYWLMDLLRKYPKDPGFNALPNVCILALAAVLVYLISAVIFTRKNA